MTRGAGAPGPTLPLALEYAAEIDARLAALRMPLGERTPSDGTFCNLRLFRDVHGYGYRPGPWPVVAGRAYDGTPILIPLFDIAAAPLEVLGEMQGADAWFYPLADEVVARLPPASVETMVQRDEADYLYAAAAFVDYRAPGLGGKRAAVARLLAAARVEVTPLAPRTRDAALAVLEGWCADKGHAADAADAPACLEALAMLGTDSPLSGFLHEVGGIPIGFVLVEWLNPGVMAVRFAKGRSAYDGVFPHLFQDLARRLAPQLRWLNFEQDLGIANFRRTKLSFRPAALLSKYRLRVRAS